MKYDLLKRHLNMLKSNEWQPTFAEIEGILGVPLPTSAHRYQAWWSNKKEGHSQTESWLRAGWDVEKVDLSAKRVHFVRVTGRAAPAARKPRRPSAKATTQSNDDVGPWSWDVETSFRHCITLTWMPIGRVGMDSSSKIVFPKAPEIPGVYRFLIRGSQKQSIYVGETDNLQRRFQHYRNPGPSQTTNIRINDLFKIHLEDGAEIGVDIATGITIKDSASQTLNVDLSLRHFRRLFENYALVVGGGTDIESLNR